MNSKEIVKDIYYVGVNDREKHLFENYIPLPMGVSYNSYLIMDEKTTLIDTVDISKASIFFHKIETILNGRSLDYLVVNHMEPDHAGSIGLLVQKYPNLTIIGNVKTINMLNGYFSLHNPLLEVKEGTQINIGKRNLSFYMAPMVHWPEVMVCYDSNDKILFSADAFGTFGCLDGHFLDSKLNTDKYWNEMRRYYACIVGKYGKPTQTALKKLSQLTVKIICPTHGPVWQKELNKAVALYDQWSRYETENGVVIAYGSMYGNTEQLAEAVAEGVIAGGVQNVYIHNVSKTDASYILADIFKYKGLIIGSPTYMTETYPLIESLLSKIAHRNIPNRIYGCFSSYSWASCAIKKLTEFGESMNWKTVGTPLENKQGVNYEDLQNAYNLGVEMAQELQKQPS